MSVDYNTSVLTNRLQQVINALDAGAGNGVMRLLDQVGNVMSSLTLAKPSAQAAGGVATFLGMPLIDPSVAQSGTPRFARCEDSTGAIVISGLTVSAGAGSTSDIVLSAPTLTAGQTLAITAATITGN